MFDIVNHDDKNVYMPDVHKHGAENVYTQLSQYFISIIEDEYKFRQEYDHDSVQVGCRLYISLHALHNASSIECLKKQIDKFFEVVIGDSPENTICDGIRTAGLVRESMLCIFLSMYIKKRTNIKWIIGFKGFTAYQQNLMN